MRLIVIVLIAAASLMSCEEQSDGCLDIFSSNFDVRAVSECDSCCTYPNFIFRLTPVFDTFIYSTSTWFPLGENDSIQIQSYQLPISNFTVRTADSQDLRSVNTIGNTDPRLIDDVIVYNNNRLFRSVFETDFSHEISQLDLTIGYDEEAYSRFRPFTQLSINTNAFSTMITDSMYVDSIGTFWQGRMRLLFSDSTFRQIELNTIPDSLLSFGLAGTLLPGENWEIQTVVDFMKVLENVSRLDSDQVISNKIADNLVESISIQ